MKKYKLEYLNMVPRHKYPSMNIAEYAEVVINERTEEGWKLEFVNIQETLIMDNPTLTYNLIFTKEK